MIRISYMASTAHKVEQEISGSLVALESAIEEVKYLCFEHEVRENKEELTISEGLKKSSQDHKFIIMKVIR